MCPEPGARAADSAVDVRELRDGERAWSIKVLTERWGAPVLARRGALVDAAALPALVAEADGERVGLLSYEVDRQDFEVVTIDALVAGRGVGTALLEAAAARAAELGCDRLWLTTTNDNVDAARFYLRRGFRLVTVHHGAVASARLLKPSIPEIGHGGVPITDELELERWVDR